MIEREPLWRNALFGVIISAIVVGFWWITSATWIAAHPGVDQNGYMVGAKNLADHFSTATTPGDPYQFVGKMWVANPAALAENPEAARYYPKYPLGFSLLAAILIKLGAGPDGIGGSWAYGLSPVLMGLALPAIFLLGRLIAGPWAGLMATLLIATSPVTLGLANNPGSHAAALAFSAWGMFLLVWWWQRGGFWRAALAGALLGYAAITRYTEGLLLLPVVLVILFNLHWGRRQSWGQVAGLLIAWAVPVVIQLSINRATLGSWTGYGPTGESGGFEWGHLSRNWENLLRTLNGTALFLSLPIGVVGLLLLAARNGRLAIVLSAWAIPGALLYGGYYWAPRAASDDPSQALAYSRFFLTLMPQVAIAAAWCLARGLAIGADARFAANRVVRWVAAPAAAVVITSGAAAYNLRAAGPILEAERRRGELAAIAGREVLAEQRVPAGSTLFGPRELLNHLQFVTDTRLYDAEMFTRAYVGQLEADTRRPEGPSLLQRDRAHAMLKLLAGKSDAELGKIARKIAADAHDDGRRVFLIQPTGGGDGGLRKVMVDGSLDRSDRRAFTVKPVASWEEPEIKRQRARWELVEVVKR